jgi:hypothetical protein
VKIKCYFYFIRRERRKKRRKNIDLVYKSKGINQIKSNCLATTAITHGECFGSLQLGNP